MPNRNIDTEVWNDPKFTDDFTAEDKYFWLFILTTRFGNMSGCFEITYKQIAKDMGYSVDSAKNLIYRFAQVHGMITYSEETNEILIHNWYKYNWSKSPKLESSIYKYINQIKSEDLKNIMIEMYESYKNGDRVSIGYQYLTNTNTISNTNTIPITIPKKKELKNDDLKDFITNVIDYLNTKLGTNYKYTTKETVSSIKARKEDGYMLETFYQVIDTKYAEWYGTEMAKHLNPTTLFRPSNFEKYANQKVLDDSKGSKKETRKLIGTNL